MARTEAQARASEKYEREKVERVFVRIPKGKKALLEEHAASCGESINAFINRAIDETMARDKDKK